MQWSGAGEGKDAVVVVVVVVRSGLSCTYVGTRQVVMRTLSTVDCVKVWHEVEGARGTTIRMDMVATCCAVHDEEDINVETDRLDVCIYACIYMVDLLLSHFLQYICGPIFIIQNHLSSLVGKKWLSLCLINYQTYWDEFK